MEKSTLRLDLKPGESIRVGDAVITLEDKSGRAARISVQADRSVPISRVQKERAADLLKGGILATA